MKKRTNLVHDESLVESCIKTTGLKARRQLVDHDLRELLRHESQMKILKLKGNVEWEGDIKALRKRRLS